MDILSTIFRMKRYVKTEEGYQLCSEWQKASEVEFDSGSDAETTLGAISGITSSLNTNNDNYALSAAGGYNLQSQVTELNTNLTAATKMTASSTITWSSDTYFGASGNQRIIKCGKICFLHLCFAIKTTVNSGGIVCLLPKDFFPKANISNYATVVYSKGQVAGVPIAFDIKTNGQIALRTTIDACAVELNCAYEVA